MKKTPNITPAEWEIMKLLWQESPQTSAKVIETLSKSVNWTPKTVRSMITRLTKKSVLGFEQRERSYYYFPLVQKKECAIEESRSFLKRVYGGSMKPMLASFLEEERLTPEEIEELQEILNRKKDES